MNETRIIKKLYIHHLQSVDFPKLSELRVWVLFSDGETVDMTDEIESFEYDVTRLDIHRILGEGSPLREPSSPPWIPLMGEA